MLLVNKDRLSKQNHKLLKTFRSKVDTVSIFYKVYENLNKKNKSFVVFTHSVIWKHYEFCFSKIDLKNRIIFHFFLKFINKFDDFLSVFRIMFFYLFSVFISIFLLIVSYSFTVLFKIYGIKPLTTKFSNIFPPIISTTLFVKVTLQ